MYPGLRYSKWLGCGLVRQEYSLVKQRYFPDIDCGWYCFSNIASEIIGLGFPYLEYSTTDWFFESGMLDRSNKIQND